MVSKQSGTSTAVDKAKTRKVLAGPGTKSQPKNSSHTGQERGLAVVEGKQPRKVPPKHGKSQKSGKAVQNGILAPQQRDTDLGANSNSMWLGAQTSGLRESGPQNMGGSGRELPFCGVYAKKVDQSLLGGSSSERRHAESGMSETAGCDIDSAGHELFLRTRQKAEAEMASVAFSNAPLASTGNLVLRRIVRVRPVGPRHMYDIEVAHPKHNFLLPNGIVTSNSETLLHFYPKDRLRMYAANKLLRRKTGEVDYGELAENVNKHLQDAKVTTTSNEIQDLLAAGSTVSADYSPDPEGESVADSYADTTNTEEVLETDQAIGAMVEKIWGLDLLEQKLLRLKGIRT